MALPVIELRGVSLSFEGKPVLEKISISVFENESLVIVGPSGQGKSTLIKMMAGLLQPDEGEVFIRGQTQVEKTKGKYSARQHDSAKRMGMLFQKNALFDSMTCAENIAFPLREVTKQAESEIQGIVDKFLEAVGIPHAKNLFPDEISGGMQKRLGIARALALSPDIIFYDDPTAGLDPITSRKIIDLIMKMKKENKSTVVAITNDMNRAFQMADRIVMVVEKKALIAGSVQETRQHQDPRVFQFIRGNINGPLTERG